MASDFIILYPSDSEFSELQSDSEEDLESLASLETDDGDDHLPEKIIADRFETNGLVWYLVKWTDCSLLRSSWESREFCHSHPELINEWLLEKERIRKGETKALDLEDFYKRVLEFEKKERQRRRIRRLKRKRTVHSTIIMALSQLWMVYGILCLLRLTISDMVSPELDTNTLCSPTNPTDCYPKIFQPTKNFQKIRPGQDVPMGLHVRMNIFTGENEARLNVPMEEGDDTVGLQALPTEKAVINIEQPKDNQKIDSKNLRDQNSIVEQPTSEGRISPPTSDEEIQTFQDALNILKDRGSSFDKALDDLSELSHDNYFGQKLAQDESVLEMLVCLTLGSGLRDKSEIAKNRERKAASILNSAFQNNPAALQEGKKNNQKIMYPSCIDIKTDKTEKKNFVTTFRSNLDHEKDSATLKIKISAISKLLKNYSFRDLFLENEGMELLLAVFVKKGKIFDEVRKKIGELLTDNFLDESLGAEINVWPRTQKSSKSSCEAGQNSLEDGCWEYHIEEFSAKVPKEEWPKELLLALNDRRKENTPKSEL